MALLGSIATVQNQAPATPTFGIAWRYIAELLRPESEVNRRIRALAAGESQKHELGEGVVAIEQAYLTKVRSEGFFESHRKNIDVQVVVEGAEILEVLDLVHARVEQPYDPDRDLIKYHDAAIGSVLKLQSGQAAVFFPADVHLPSLRIGADAVLVRKSVLKLPVGPQAAK
jgi:biofilm protein TabA